MRKLCLRSIVVEEPGLELVKFNELLNSLNKILKNTSLDLIKSLGLLTNCTFFSDFRTLSDSWSWSELSRNEKFWGRKLGLGQKLRWKERRGMNFMLFICLAWNSESDGLIIGSPFDIQMRSKFSKRKMMF